MSSTLIYIPSHTIVDYVTKNPVNWIPSHAYLAKRGGLGDQCGVTPTPAVYEFLQLLQKEKRLFTQKEYRDYCFNSWVNDGWIDGLGSKKRGALGVRLYRNFYPSMIDSLHVWAMLAETKFFDACIIDSTMDAVAKTDLLLKRGDTEYHVALLAGSKQSVDDRHYKLTYRNDGENVVCYDVKLPMKRERNPGNKRWYEIADFDSLVQVTS